MRLALCALLLCALSGAEGASAARVGVVALSDLDEAALVDATAASLEARAGSGELTLVGPAKLAPVVQKLRGAGRACDVEDQACLVKVGIFARLDELLAVEIRDERASVKMIDVGRAEELDQAEGPVGSGQGGPLLAGLVRRAVAGEAQVASLAVWAPAGAGLALDGHDVGVAPLAGPLGPLVPGEVEVSAAADPQRLAVRVTLSPGERATVTLARVAPEPASSGELSDEPSASPAKPGDLLSPVLITLGAAGLALTVGAVVAGGVQAGIYAFGYPAIPAQARNGALGGAATAALVAIVGAAAALGAGAGWAALALIE